MRLTIFMLSVVLSMTSAPALAEWSFLDKAAGGSEWFIDFATIKKGKTTRAWILNNYSKDEKSGDMSASALALHEANCGEEQTRRLTIIFYSGSFGAGSVTSQDNKPGEWKYPAPGTILEDVLKALCGKRQ